MGEGHTGYEMLFGAVKPRWNQGSGHQTRKQLELLRLESKALGSHLPEKAVGSHQTENASI